MFLLVLAHPGCPRQNPKSRKTVVCVCVCAVIRNLVEVHAIVHCYNIETTECLLITVLIECGCGIFSNFFELEINYFALHIYGLYCSCMFIWDPVMLCMQ